MMSILLMLFIALSGILLISTIYFAISNVKLKGELSQLRLINSSDTQLQEKFKLLAVEALESNSNQFLNLAKMTLEKENVVSKAELDKQKTAIGTLVDPLKKSLEEYQNQVQALEKERQKSYLQVEGELKRIAEIGQTLNHETAALKNALKKPHVRGRWGEIQLKNCVELAGMSEFSDVEFQNNNTLEDGTRLIPDMTVHMPGGRTVIVDAKTPLEAFIASLEAVDDESRQRELVRHGKHVKEHIKKLSLKEYQQNIKASADFTVLFLPNESFLYAALEVEPDLMEFAISRKILVSTPPTLIGLLKVIRYGWNEARLAENAQKISETGIELHKRLVEFVEGYLNVGSHIEKALDQYKVGLNRLESRVIGQAKKLEVLGAKSTKELPTSDLSKF